MASRDEDFFRTAEDWSRRKHLILDYYLTPAAAKLRRVSPDGRVVILDGFARRGAYEDGTPGSPVLMGQAAMTWKRVPSLMSESPPTAAEPGRQRAQVRRIHV